MKILLCPDIHFGAHENDPNFIDYQFNCVEFIYETANKYNIENIAFLGDILDKRRVINIKILDYIYRKFVKPGFNHYFLLGNHDTYYKNNNELNAIDILFKDHKVVSHLPEEIKFGEKSVLFTPWINKENYQQSLEIINNSKAEYLFGHLDLSGFELMRGFISEHSSIPLKELDKFDKVISGHYHCYSQKGNITYLGSLCQLNWSDVSEKKYLGVLDVETDELQLIEIPHTYYCIKRIRTLQDMEEDVECYRNKKVKIYLYMDRKIKVEKYIASVVEIASSVNVIDEQIVLGAENIDIESHNLSINQLWLAYLDELELESNDKKIINDIFNKTYSSVSTGNLEIFNN